MRINLLQGLRQKKRVKEMIAKLTQSIYAYNSVVLGAAREVDVRKAIRLRSELKTYLVDLKLKMQDVCRPIQRDILMTAELKDELTFYQKMSVTRGKSFVQVNHYTTPEAYDYDAVILKPEVDQRCMKLQKDLDELYSKIDAFNVSNFIEIDEILDERLNEPFHCG